LRLPTKPPIKHRLSLPNPDESIDIAADEKEAIARYRIHEYIQNKEELELGTRARNNGAAWLAPTL
jgi:hypothetical protein